MITAPDTLLKVEGAGNDFVLGTGSWAPRLADDAELVRRLCHRRRGVGADGALALFAESTGRVRLTHRNADGSASSFCANGARCAALAAVERLGATTELVIVTGWAEITATVTPDAITLELPAPGPVAPVDVGAGARSWPGWRLDVGVPHLVLPVAGLAALDAAAVAGPLRRHPAAGDDGANVHLVEVDGDALAIRTMERGVETEVLCCGSGVVAAALVTLAGSGGGRLDVVPRSGDRLTVEALGGPPRAPSRLTGPARLVAVIEPLAEG